MHMIKGKKIFNEIGKVFTILSIVFIAYKFILYKDDLYRVLTRRLLLPITFTLLVESVAIIGNAYFYWNILQIISENKIRKRVVLSIYGKSNLFKYLPGNVIQYIGRNQIASESSISYKAITFVSLVEVVCCCISAIIISGFFSFRLIREWIAEQHVGGNVIGVVAVILMILLFWFFGYKANREFLSRWGRKILNNKSLLVILLMICFESICSILFGISYIWSLNVVGKYRIDSKMYPVLIGAYTFAWIVGFITPGSPGGIGVREAITMLLLEGMGYQEDVGSAAVINRLSCITGDVIIYIFLKAYGRHEKT